MTKEQAKEILSEYELLFEIQDYCFGDGSCKVEYKYLLDSHAEAETFIEALKTLLQ